MTHTFSIMIKLFQKIDGAVVLKSIHTYVELILLFDYKR